MTKRLEKPTPPQAPRAPRTRLYIANDPTVLRICPELAVEIGLTESILLLQIDFWIQMSDNERDSRYWTYQSTRAMRRKAFPFWSPDTINRAIHSLAEEHYITVANYNKYSYDQTRWLALDPEGIAKLKSVKLGVYENRTALSENRTRSTENRTTIPETPTETPTENTDSVVKTANGTARKPRRRNDLFDTLVEVTHSDPDTAGGYVGGVASRLKKYAAADVRRWFGPGGWWYAVRCAGMTSPPVPSLAGVEKSIGLAAEWDAAQRKNKTVTDGQGVFL